VIFSSSNGNENKYSIGSFTANRANAGELLPFRFLKLVGPVEVFSIEGGFASPQSPDWRR
jgi:hypothetical protein